MKLVSFSKVFFRKLWRDKYGWSGDYPNWQSANLRCSGYDSENILQKVKAAILEVKNGTAVYERDSVLFNKIEYSWPLLSALMWVAAKNKGKINVIDFGGSLGSSYFQNKHFLNTIDVKWNIIEQDRFIELGQEFIKDNQINFFYSVEEAVGKNGPPDLLILACTLPYLKQPYDSLMNLMKYDIPHLIIDNTPFNYEPRDRITIQKVPPEIYSASYPCWFLDYNKVAETISLSYNIISEHKNDSSIYLDGRKINYRGFLAGIRTMEA